VNCFASAAFDEEKDDCELLLELGYFPSLEVIFAHFETI
jgi:hypothetical protein